MKVTKPGFAGTMRCTTIVCVATSGFIESATAALPLRTSVPSTQTMASPTCQEALPSSAAETTFSAVRLMPDTSGTFSTNVSSTMRTASL